MNSKKKKSGKVHRNFKLPKDLNKALVAEAEKTSRTQTAVLEMALKNFLFQKAA